MSSSVAGRSSRGSPGWKGGHSMPTSASLAEQELVQPALIALLDRAPSLLAAAQLLARRRNLWGPAHLHGGRVRSPIFARAILPAIGHTTKKKVPRRPRPPAEKQWRPLYGW